MAKVAIAIRITAGTNHAETLSASFWMGARDRWASPTSFTIWARSVSAPTRRASTIKAPLPFTVPPVTASPAVFSAGIGSPVTIASSTALVPSTTTPSTGTVSPGRTRSRSPTAMRSMATSSSAPSGRRTRSRREVQERADRAAGPRPSPQLQDLAQEHEGDDHRRGLEVHRQRAAVSAEGRGEQAGHERRRDAVRVGGAGAEGDEREHVQVAVHDRPPSTLEERPAAPEDDRRRQRELDPERPRSANRVGDARDHVRDHEAEQGQGQDGRDPEPPLHGVELGVLLLEAGDPRFQRHAADGARPRAVAHDLRVHRARVLRPGDLVFHGGHCWHRFLHGLPDGRPPAGRRGPHRAYWPGFFSNFALQPAEQK